MAVTGTCLNDRSGGIYWQVLLGKGRGVEGRGLHVVCDCVT